MEGVGEPCELLPWDSAFFNVTVARVRGNVLTPILSDAIDAWCKTHRVDCLYFIARADDVATVTLAEVGGYHLADVRMTFERALDETTGEQSGSGVKIREVSKEDVPVLKEIARAGHTETRFYYDPQFTRAQCETLYETWIQRSCEGYADAVLVAEKAGKACGYVACHLNKGQKSGSIGLLAVDRAMQGKGVGRALVSAAMKWCAAQGAARMSVVTQGRNTAAQRLYERSGFVASKVELYYHRWFRGAASSAAASAAGMAHE